MALRLARKLINPTKLPRESEGTDREARSKKAPKFTEANQAANRARMNTDPPSGTIKSERKMNERIRIDPFATLKGENFNRIKLPDKRPSPLTNITKAPPQANWIIADPFHTSANKEGSQLPRVIMAPHERAW